MTCILAKRNYPTTCGHERRTLTLLAVVGLLASITVTGCVNWARPGATGFVSPGGTLFVSPDGNAAWSGKLATPNAGRTDGPLPSIESARDALRALRAKGEAKQQTIVVGPVAALESIKMLGTNGGGFYGMNSAHPFENPTGLSNFWVCLSMMIFPFTLVLMYGRMLGRMRHALVIFSVMLLLMAGTIFMSVYYDTLKPNPGLTSHPVARTHEIPSATAPGGKRVVTLPAVAGLPVDQHLGNLEGKEMRFGTSAGAVRISPAPSTACCAMTGAVARDTAHTTAVTMNRL